MNRILGTQTMKRSFQLMGLLIAFTCSSFAGPITFTDLTTASGMIGSTPFLNAAITITGIGDTSNIQSFSGGFFINDNSASVTITGVGTFQFITATRFFVNNTGELVGFSRAGSTGLDLIDGPTNSAFSSWGMLTSIGPFMGPGSILQWSASPVNTSGGTLVLDDGTPNVTFSAQVGGTTPEPGTFLLFATAVLGAGRFVKRKIAS
jgi:hypothetical protein